MNSNEYSNWKKFWVNNVDQTAFFNWNDVYDGLENYLNSKFPCCVIINTLPNYDLKIKYIEEEWTFWVEDSKSEYKGFFYFKNEEDKVRFLLQL